MTNREDESKMELLIAAVPDEKILWVAESKDVAVCRGRILSVLSTPSQGERVGSLVSKIHPIDLEELATTLRRTIYNAYLATLVGSPAEVTRRYYERAKEPQIGDLVTEASTVYRMRHEGATDLDGVGTLEEIAWEEVDFGDPEFVWDEEVEGRPHPTENVYYIRTLDGRRFRWVNANFVSAVSGRYDVMAEFR